ncbi:MAG: urease accessory protein UreD [Oscillospiraceae bacterium]|nr:urease accessory protein UreD [Oscillospiraceae bacterium]
MSRLYICAENKNGRTVITDSFFSSPIKIAKPFYYPRYTEIMMMTASAGMLDGDIYEIEIVVKENASLKFTGQSFTKIFKSGEKGGAVQRVKITVENGGRFLYLPQPVIPFAESIFDGRTEIFLGNEASFLMQDIFSCGRTAMNEQFAFTSYRSRTAVHIDGTLAFLDNVKLLPNEADLSGIGFFEGHTHSGMMYSFNSDTPDSLCGTNAHKGKVIRMLSDSAQEILNSFSNEK